MQNNDLKAIFARNLKEYLKLNEKTQTDLVNDLELKTSTVSDWCNGIKFPRADKIELLANYFHIEKSDLINEMSTAIGSHKGIGSKIKQARLLRGFSEEDLANLIGVKQALVKNYENDISHPREEILYKLFNALQVDANYLFEGQYSAKNETLAAHRPDGYDEDLPKEAQEELKNFVEYLKTKYKK